MTRHKLKIISVTSLLLFVVIWWVAVRIFDIKEFFLPSPVVVGRAIHTLFVHGFITDIGVSIVRVGVGFIIATMCAVPIGIAVGMNKHIEAVLEPIIDFIRYTPVPAFIPLFILWFGIGELEKIIVIASTVFFQLVLMVANDVAAVPETLIHSAQTLGSSRMSLVRHVIIPHAKPRIVDDLRISMGWAWSSLIMAEIVGASSGMGYVIIQSQRLLQTANVMGSLVVIGIVGVIIDVSFKLFHKKMFVWVRHVSS